MVLDLTHGWLQPALASVEASAAPIASIIQTDARLTAPRSRRRNSMATHQIDVKEQAWLSDTDRGGKSRLDRRWIEAVDPSNLSQAVRVRKQSRERNRTVSHEVAGCENGANLAP